MTRHFLRDDDLTPDEQAGSSPSPPTLKQAPYDAKPLAGPQTVAMIFDKQTLRTQASFAAGIAELGGYPMLVDGALAGIGVRESVADVARVLGRQASVIVWRTYGQDRLEAMAEHAGVPVVNALTDDFHPCQLLADLLTIREHKGDARRAHRRLRRRRRLQHGQLLAARRRHRRHARPGQRPRGLHARPRRWSTRRSGIADEHRRLGRCSSPTRARRSTDADVVVTDTWISMGKEDEAAERAEVFRDWSVTDRAVRPGQARRDRPCTACRRTAARRSTPR